MFYSKCGKLAIILLYYFLFSLNQVNCDLVLLNLNDEASTPDTQLQICALKKQFNDSLKDYYKKISLIEVTPYNGCQQINNQTFFNKTIFFRLYNGSNCSANTILSNLQDIGAALTIIGSNGPIKINFTDVYYTVSPIFMPIMHAEKLSAFIKSSVAPVVELTSTNHKFDVAMIFIWLIAVFTVIFGSLWSSYEFKLSLKRQAMDTESEHKVNENATNLDAPRVTKTNKVEENRNEAALLSLSYFGIFILLAFVIVILLLLYFFYNVIIYFVYVIFSFGAITSMYRIGDLVLYSFNCAQCLVPENNLPILKSRPKVANLILSFICITTCVLWFVFRHSNWIWIIQNIMAISLAANALSFYRLSSYRIVTFMLVLFFLYDVFMVFISPLITQGTSIMEAVAIGGRDSNAKTSKDSEILFSNNSVEDINRLPVVIVIPRLSQIAQLCSYYLDYPYSLLGLGDILIPGLSVNYAILFDIASNNRYRTYFLANLFAYGLGLFLAMVGLIFMDKAQPALFYLCPTHLLVTYLIALCKNEVRSLWTGEPIHQYAVANAKNTSYAVDNVGSGSGGGGGNEEHEPAYTAIQIADNNNNNNNNSDAEQQPTESKTLQPHENEDYKY